MLDAGSAASSIGAVAGGIEAGINADLALAVASGNGQQLRVDLQALYDYYFKVKAVHEQFQAALRNLPQEPYSSQVLEVSRIQGVTDSVQTTVVQALAPDIYSGGTLKKSASVVAARLAEHLCKIADTYKAYVQVDDQKASELQTAGDAGAGDINYGGGSRATLLALEEAAAAAGVAVTGTSFLL
ncbi:MAG TPA: hypothetical protein VIG48_06705 [Jatrophihabitans sp.]|jgi:hypothetical protein